MLNVEEEKSSPCLSASSAAGGELSNEIVKFETHGQRCRRVGMSVRSASALSAPLREMSVSLLLHAQSLCSTVYCLSPLASSATQRDIPCFQ
jgi:hypothetical protein